MYKCIIVRGCKDNAKKQVGKGKTWNINYNPSDMGYQKEEKRTSR